VKESFTAAIVARSLLAAERSTWVVGVLLGWVVVRRELVWPVSWDVVVAVLMCVPVFGVLKGTEMGVGGTLSPPIRPSPWRIRPKICPIRPCPCPIRPNLVFEN
jgi:hypothetical protein